MTEITTGTVQNDEQIIQLLALQQRNLKRNISLEEMETQGFVTVEHNFEKLMAMNTSLPQVIALKNKKVIGYALSMPISFKYIITELTPMCELLESLSYKNKKLSEYNYYIMGQICIDKSVRGLGVFQKLYLQHALEFSDRFDFVITEVSVNNKRSMRAHENVGFKIIHEYYDPTNNETWAIILWEFVNLVI